MKLFNYSPQIEEVHHAFATASDVLLADADETLKKHIPNEDKATRLMAIGFFNAKEVRETGNAIYRKKKALEDATLIKYYQQHYPLNKFITDEKVNELCQKYGLLLGATRLYKGFVPEVKLAEIENFKLREEDKEVEDEYDGMSVSATISEVMRAAAPIQRPFLICAPEHDFIMADQSKEGIRIVPDPVVLQPVRGGYLIVAAWGDEASDPIVVNGINN